MRDALSCLNEVPQQPTKRSSRNHGWLGLGGNRENFYFRTSWRALLHGFSLTPWHTAYLYSAIKLFEPEPWISDIYFPLDTPFIYQFINSRGLKTWAMRGPRAAALLETSWVQRSEFTLTPYAIAIYTTYVYGIGNGRAPLIVLHWAALKRSSEYIALANINWKVTFCSHLSSSWTNCRAIHGEK